MILVIVIVRKDRNETILNFNNNDNGEVWNSKFVEECLYFIIHVWVCIYLLFEFKAMLNLLRCRFFQKVFLYLYTIKHQTQILRLLVDFIVELANPAGFDTITRLNPKFLKLVGYDLSQVDSVNSNITIVIIKNNIFPGPYLGCKVLSTNNRKTYIWLWHWSCIGDITNLSFWIFTKKDSGILNTLVVMVGMLGPYLSTWVNNCLSEIFFLTFFTLTLTLYLNFFSQTTFLFFYSLMHTQYLLNIIAIKNRKYKKKRGWTSLSPTPLCEMLWFPFLWTV